MAYYVKVTPEVAKALGVERMRNKTSDGNYLLWQADLNRFPEATLPEKVSRVGGALLDIWNAKKETDGKSGYVPKLVSTPGEFSDETEGSKTEPISESK